MTGFEPATFMTVYRRLIHYATNISLWLYVHINILDIKKYMDCVKMALLFVNTNVIL